MMAFASLAFVSFAFVTAVEGAGIRGTAQHAVWFGGEQCSAKTASNTWKNMVRPYNPNPYPTRNHVCRFCAPEDVPALCASDPSLHRDLATHTHCTHSRNARPLCAPLLVPESSSASANTAPTGRQTTVTGRRETNVWET